MTYIRPIDFSGMVQRTNDISTLKQQQDAKPVQDQSNIAQNVHKNVEHATKEVAKKDNADYAEQKYDAKEKGKNQYVRLDSKRKKKDTKTQEKSSSSIAYRGFDMKI